VYQHSIYEQRARFVEERLERVAEHQRDLVLFELKTAAAEATRGKSLRQVRLESAMPGFSLTPMDSCDACGHVMRERCVSLWLAVEVASTFAIPCVLLHAAVS
jgi:hypothetical protein